MATLQRTAVLFALAAAAFGAAGCETPESATGLVEEGPPTIRQVFMSELYDNNGTLSIRSALAFGTHDLIPPERTHPVTAAATNTQTIRVVFDEILRGNALEEIRCRTRQLSEVDACVVPGGYSRVPVGATPDDIASCAVANDLLDSQCGGPMAVCLNDEGIPCGVDDEDENGSADNTRMIAGQVRIVCAGTGGTEVDVPLDIEASYWQPAGNQQVPARQSPEGSLGPALVIKTQGQLLPTSSNCRLVLAPDIVDKDDLQVCAPPGGDPNAACTPGDLSLFSFGTTALRLTSTIPEAGMTGVDPATAQIAMFWSAPLAPASVTLSTVTVSPALPNPMIRVNPQNANQIQLDTGGNLMPATTYTVTITTGLTDSFGVPIPAPITFSFTTT